MKKRIQVFTMIELLVVIGIIAILTSMLRAISSGLARYSSGGTCLLQSFPQKKMQTFGWQLSFFFTLLVVLTGDISDFLLLNPAEMTIFCEKN